MIFIYGDSHANSNFKNIALPCNNCHINSSTMHRIGRDSIILNCRPNEHDKNSILVFDFGEVDCRCHIKRQINLGRLEDDVIHELIDRYFAAIPKNVIQFREIIVSAIVPPTIQADYENVHGPITHEYPFVGSDQERSRFTEKMNAKIKEYCEIYDYTYFDPFDYYKNDIGCLKFELSDTFGHIKENSHILEKFVELVLSISNK